MARPREFDTDDALAKAMDVFWKQGYGEARLPDLLAGMKLTRGSLYKAFKDKKSLFLRVLSDYDEQAVSGAVRLLSGPDMGGWERICALFESIAEAVENGDRRGCLLCSAVAGPACYDPDIAAFAVKSLDRMRAGFQQALEDAGMSRDAVGMAHFLVSQYVGLRVLSRADIPASTIRLNVRALRSLVKPAAETGPA